MELCINWTQSIVKAEELTYINLSVFFQSVLFLLSVYHFCRWSGTFWEDEGTSGILSPWNFFQNFQRISFWHSLLQYLFKTVLLEGQFVVLNLLWILGPKIWKVWIFKGCYLRADLSADHGLMDLKRKAKTVMKEVFFMEITDAPLALPFAFYRQQSRSKSTKKLNPFHARFIRS